MTELINNTHTSRIKMGNLLQNSCYKKRKASWLTVNTNIFIIKIYIHLNVPFNATNYIYKIIYYKITAIIFTKTDKFEFFNS